MHYLRNGRVIPGFENEDVISADAPIDVDIEQLSADLENAQATILEESNKYNSALEAMDELENTIGDIEVAMESDVDLVTAQLLVNSLNKHSNTLYGKDLQSAGLQSETPSCVLDTGLTDAKVMLLELKDFAGKVFDKINEYLEKYNESAEVVGEVLVEGTLNDFKSLIKEKNDLVKDKEAGLLSADKLSAISDKLNIFIDKTFGEDGSTLKTNMKLSAGLLSGYNLEAGLESITDTIKSMGQKLLDFVYKIYQNLANYIAQLVATVITSSKGLEKEVRLVSDEDRKLPINALKFAKTLVNREIPLSCSLNGSNMQSFQALTNDFLLYMWELTATDNSPNLLLKRTGNGMEVVEDRGTTGVAGFMFKTIVDNAKFIMSDADIKRLNNLKSTTKTIEIIQGKKLVAITTDVTSTGKNGEAEALGLFLEQFGLSIDENKWEFPSASENFDAKETWQLLEKNIKVITSGKAKEVYFTKIKGKKEYMKKIIEDEYKKIDEGSDEIGLFNNIQRYVKATWKIYPEVYLKKIYALNSANRNIFAALKSAKESEKK